MIPDDEFQRRLDEALSHYSQTLNLLDNLLRHRRSSQDIVLLSCSRLDSLANLAYPADFSQQNAFRRFVTSHSGDRTFFNSISVGDLHWFLLHNAEFAYVMIERPGRAQRVGPDSDRYLAFVEESGIPVTGDAVYRLTRRICTLLRRHFRVKPRQSLAKHALASPLQIKEALAGELANEGAEVISALDPLFEHFKVSSILYRRYRNKAIHGLRVILAEKEFFAEERPFHGIFESGDLGSFLQIEFPGRFLRNLLEACLTTLRMHLRAKKKLPWDLFNAVFPFEEVLAGDVIEYIDDRILAPFDRVRWQLRTR